MICILVVRGQKVTSMTHSPGVWDTFEQAEQWMNKSEIWHEEYSNCDRAILVDCSSGDSLVLE